MLHSALLVSPPSPLPRLKMAAGLKLPGSSSDILMTLSLSFPSCTGGMWVVRPFWRATKQYLSGVLKILFPLTYIGRSLS